MKVSLILWSRFYNSSCGSTFKCTLSKSRFGGRSLVTQGTTSVNKISRLIPLPSSHRYKCETRKKYTGNGSCLSFYGGKFLLKKIFRSQSTLKYDRGKVSIETESRTLLPLLITYENLRMSETTVTLTHKQNNETSRTGKGKYVTLEDVKNAPE